LKEIASHLLLGLLVFTFVIFIRHIGSPLEIIARHNLPSSKVFKLFLLPIPAILALTIPMAVLMGTLIGLSRMAADGEVTAVRASGIGLMQFVRPVMAFAFIGWLLTSSMSLWLGPEAARELNRMELALKTSQIPYEIQPRVFLEQFPNLLLYLEDVTSSRSQWHGVFIADSTQPGTLKITLAESGVLVNEVGSNRLTLHLQQGTTHEFDPRHPEQYSVISFTETDLPIPLDVNAAAVSQRRPLNTLSLGQLLRQTRNPP
jgi:lipopolysaccharide export LptBFGC system permease protein LptF